MDREHRLTFCSRCKHKKFDTAKGVICGLTDDVAKFYSSCKDFSGDKTSVDLTIKRRELNKIHEEEQGRYRKAPKISVWGIIGFIAFIISLVNLYLTLFS